MKTRIFLILPALFVFSFSQAQKLPVTKEIVKAMDKANGCFMNKWPDPGAPIVHPDKTRPSNIWTRAVYYEGLMAFYNCKPMKQFLDYAIRWGQHHNWTTAYNQDFTRNADNQACGQTYIDLFLIDNDPLRITPIKTTIDSMMCTSKIDDWYWIDAIQMAMPVFARLGFIYQDTTYFNRMVAMYSFTRNVHGEHGLFNQEDGLWWRDKDFDPPYYEPNGGDCYWSRGNGWVLAALVRTMDFLSEESPYYQLFLDDFKKMASALIPVQRKDGFWNVSLHDSTNFSGRELTGTALFTYGIAWGIHKGYLESKVYLPVVVKAWDAMVKYSLHPDGMLGFVQGTGKEPKDGQPVTYDRAANFEDYGLGCFLLAGSEMFKLSKDNH